MLTGFDPIWERIIRFEGQTFATSSGQPFSYDVLEDTLAVRRSDLTIPRDALEAAYRSGAASGKEKGRGLTAYINALLRDNRIRS